MTFHIVTIFHDFQGSCKKIYLMKRAKGVDCLLSSLSPLATMLLSIARLR